QLVERVKAIPGVVDLDTSFNSGKPELSVQVDRPKAADLGVQVADAAEALGLLVGGYQSPRCSEGGGAYGAQHRESAVCPSTTSRTSRRARRPPRSTAWHVNAR